jgi:DNA-binding MarR family transcriptional regulator
MSTAEHSPGPPHFAITGREDFLAEAKPPGSSRVTQPLPGSAEDIGALLMRGAECLTAALLECTAEAGLNEARYRLLDSLHQRTRGESSQSELAIQLLQSESNLSTLLERMSGDGLITRTRSQTDRRRSLIRMTPAGLEALMQANRARAATVVRLLRFFSTREAEHLAEGLQRLVGDLENAPEVCARRACGVDPASALSRPTRRSPVGLTASGASRDDRQ